MTYKPDDFHQGETSGGNSDAGSSHGQKVFLFTYPVIFSPSPNHFAHHRSEAGLLSVMELHGASTGFIKAG